MAKAKLVEQRGFHKMRVAVERPGDIADPLGEVLWEEYVDIDPEMQPKLEAARIEGERQLKFFNGEASDAGNRSTDEREGQGGGGGAAGDDGPGSAGAASGNVLELPCVQRDGSHLPPQVAGDGADTAARPGVGEGDGIRGAGPVPGDASARLVPGMGDGAQGRTAGDASRGTVDPQHTAAVRLLRPELMTAAQLFRKLADDCERAGDGAPPFCLAVVIHKDGVMQNWIKMMPGDLALVGSQLQAIAVNMSTAMRAELTKA